MERSLFNWSDWAGEPECLSFYDPVLNVRIGNFLPGTKFPVAQIRDDNGFGILTFHDDDGNVIAKFRLDYKVSEF